MADTRKDKRAPVSLKVRFKSATVDEFIEHYSKDVSRGGIYIKSGRPMQVGTLLKFQFQLKDESALIRGVGRVVWTRVEEDATADNPAGMGIKFIKMDNDSRAIVERIVDAHEPEQGTYESGRHSASSAEASSAPPPSESDLFFPDLPPAELPPPEDRTAVRQATEFLAAALTEGSTDALATREAQDRAEQARQRQHEVETERKREAEQKKQAAERKSNGEQKKQLEAQQAEQQALAEARKQAEAAVVPQKQQKPLEHDAAAREQTAQRALEEPHEAAPASNLPSMIIDPSLEPRVGRPSEEARGSDATPLPRTHAALLAESSDEPDTEPPPASSDAPDSPTTSIPQHAAAARKNYVPYVVIAVLVLVAAIVALRDAPEERAADAIGEEQQDESLREVQDQPATISPAPPVEPALPAPPSQVAPEPADSEGVEPGAPAPAVVAAPPALPAPVLIKVDVSTTPRGAEIWVGDELRGKSPLTLELPAGVLAVVRARADGRVEARSELTPTAKTSIKLKLKETPWVVHVESTPPGASVNVGGHKGVAPVDLTLDAAPTAELSVNAKLDGFEIARTRLAPSAFSASDGAMSAQLSLTLKPSLPADTSKDATPLSAPKQPAAERVKKEAPAPPKAEPKASVQAPPSASESTKPVVKPAESKPPAEPPTKLPDNPFGD